MLSGRLVIYSFGFSRVPYYVQRLDPTCACIIVVYFCYISVINLVPVWDIVAHTVNHRDIRFRYLNNYIPIHNSTLF